MKLLVKIQDIILVNVIVFKSVIKVVMQIFSHIGNLDKSSELDFTVKILSAKFV